MLSQIVSNRTSVTDVGANFRQALRAARRRKFPKKNKMSCNEKVDLTIARSWALGRMVWMGWLGVFSDSLKKQAILSTFFPDGLPERRSSSSPLSRGGSQLPAATSHVLGSGTNHAYQLFQKSIFANLPGGMSSSSPFSRGGSQLPAATSHVLGFGTNHACQLLPKGIFATRREVIFFPILTRRVSTTRCHKPRAWIWHK